MFSNPLPEEMYVDPIKAVLWQLALPQGGYKIREGTDLIPIQPNPIPVDYSNHHTEAIGIGIVNQNRLMFHLSFRYWWFVAAASSV